MWEGRNRSEIRHWPAKSSAFATSILFKLRDDEAKRLDDEYSILQAEGVHARDERRGVIVRYAPPIKRGSKAHVATTLLPGSLIWANDGVKYDLLEWRNESGVGLGKPQKTSVQTIDFFQLVRAAALASILNIIPARDLAESRSPRAPSLSSSPASRATAPPSTPTSSSPRPPAPSSQSPSTPKLLLALVCEHRCTPTERDSTRAFCLETFQFARKRLEADPARLDVTGWSGIARIFGEESAEGFPQRSQVGADSHAARRTSPSGISSTRIGAPSSIARPSAKAR